MRLLFEIDKKDYEHCTRHFVRNSARSIEGLALEVCFGMAIGVSFGNTSICPHS